MERVVAWSALALACFDSVLAWIAIRLLHGVASAMLIPVFQAYAAELEGAPGKSLAAEEKEHA